MTLTQAADAFEQAEEPSVDTALNLLRVAKEYWDDGMIGKDTYEMYVQMAAYDLLQIGRTVQ